MRYNQIKIIALLVLLLLSVGFESTSAKEINKFSILFNPIVLANVGRSYGLNVQYELSKKIRVYAGGKYHQNLLVDPKFNNQKLRNRFYSNSLSQNIGINAGVNYKIKWPYSVLKPYVYYDITYFNMDTRALIITDVDSNNAQGGIQPKWVTPVKYYDVHSFENNIGLGLTCNFTKRISVNTRGGIGANFIFNLPQAEYENGRHVNLSFQYAVGVQYEF